MLGKALGQALVKEYSFKFTVGAEPHLSVVERVVLKLSSCPARFRLKLDGSSRSEANRFYGVTCYEVAGKAADYVALGGSTRGVNKTKHLSQNLPAPPIQILQPLQLQEWESD